MRVRGLWLSLVLILTAFLQINCANNSSTNLLMGKWHIKEIEIGMFNNEMIIKLNPTAGEIDVKPDGQYNGYFIISFPEPGNHKILSGKINHNLSAKSIELVPDNSDQSGFNPMVFNYEKSYDVWDIFYKTTILKLDGTVTAPSGKDITGNENTPPPLHLRLVITKKY